MRRFAVRKFLVPSVTAGFLALLPGALSAQILVNITIDENCHGTLDSGGAVALPCSLLTDPGPGGKLNALFYNLLGPTGLVTGDVVITEPGGGTSDILRFDAVTQGGGVFVYSDASEADLDLADIGFPDGQYTNLLTVTEVGAEGSNGITYTPTAGQPGFVGIVPGGVTYNFISDAAGVPEPATGVLLLMGGGAILLIRRRRA